MVSPFSGWVLGSGALLASPALWAAFVDGTMSVETAVIRLAVAVLVAWVGFSLLASLLSGTAEPVLADDDGGGELPAGDGSEPVRGAVVDSTVEQDSQPT